MKNTLFPLFLIFILSLFLSPRILRAQELTYTESDWQFGSKCNCGLFEKCNCTQCQQSYKTSMDVNYSSNPEKDPSAGTEYRYIDIPTEIDFKTITAYAGDKKVGVWKYYRKTGCGNSYSYYTDVKYIRYKDSYIDASAISNRTYLEIIKDDANGYFLNGETRKTDKEIEKDMEEKNKKSLSKIRLNNIPADELKFSKFYCPKIGMITTLSSDGITSEEGKIVTYMEYDVFPTERSGRWTYVDQSKGQLKIFWENSNTPEFLSINLRDGKNYGNFYYTDNGRIDSFEIICLNLNHKTSDTANTIFKQINRITLLRDGDVCLWKGEASAIGKTKDVFVKSLNKNVTFTCSNVQNHPQWVSELCSKAYFCETGLSVIWQNEISLNASSPGCYMGKGDKACIVRVFKDKNGKLATPFCTEEKFQEYLDEGEITKPEHKKKKNHIW